MKKNLPSGEKEGRMNIERIKSLSNAFGPAGFEDGVARLIPEIYKGKKKLESDTMNNVLIGLKEKKKLRIMLDAHIDEVGFMVSHVKDNGMLGLHALGGWVEYNLPSQAFLIRNDKGQLIRGVVASQPPHFMSEEERNRGLKLEQLVVDLGVTSAQEVSELGIGIGSPMVPDVGFSYDEKRNLLMGKAFDCRLGVAALLDSLEELEGLELDVELVASLSSQEEGGLRGAQVSARRLEPDLAIVFEGSPADDSFMAPPLAQTLLHKGPMLRHVDRGMITHPGFQRFALNLARESGFDVQEAVRSGGATNGSPIHLSNQGVPTIVIGIPVRYIHSHNGFASMKDYKTAVNLAVEIVKAMNEDVYKTFKPF